ncbi:MAG: hypothetical protein LBI26_02030 [Holosporales bacterium]|nr:hypothetical protein [Holosporales bacterium]
MKTAVLRNVRNRLRISFYSGAAPNLRDPSFGDKSENFGRIGQFGEWVYSDLSSAFVNMAVGKSSDTTHFVCLSSFRPIVISH